MKNKAMTRKEEIRNKADEFAQKYFPNKNNIWARENIEAQCVSSACIEMAKWVDENSKEANGKELLYVCQRTSEITKKEMIEKACEWISQIYTNGVLDWKNCDAIINDFRKAMEE